MDIQAYQKKGLGGCDLHLSELAFLQGYLALEYVRESVVDLHRVADVDLGNVVPPKRKLHCAGFVLKLRIADIDGSAVLLVDGSWLPLVYDLGLDVDLVHHVFCFF